MRFIADMAKRFRRDEDGAAMVEYTILLGIITVAVIGSVIAVGNWVGLQWTELEGILPADAEEPVDPPAE